MATDQTFEQAERFLKSHYQDDALDDDQIRRDAEHWNRVLGDAERFPNADLDFIDRFDSAACTYLGGLSHNFTGERRKWYPHLDYAGEPMLPGQFRDPPEQVPA